MEWFGLNASRELLAITWKSMSTGFFFLMQLLILQAEVFQLWVTEHSGKKRAFYLEK